MEGTRTSRAGAYGDSPARLYATLIGATLVVAGIIGFFYNASFDVGDSIESDEVFGLLAVNAWHNIVHIATGAVLLLAAGSSAVREVVLGFAAAYFVVFLLGVFEVGGENTIFKFIPVNTEDNVLHIILAGLALAAGLATPKARPAAPAARPAA
jgi:hypothetical protein